MNAHERAASSMTDRAIARLLEDLERLAADAGISHAALARAAGLSPGFLADVFARHAAPSIRTCARLAVPLGADLSLRLYPNTGPTVRDRHQARIFEALLGILGGGWRPHSEASVWRPVRGTIDALLHDPRAGLVVATEIESDMRRIEQTIRWSREKSEALSSWSGWPSVLGTEAAAPRVSRLLVVRRTRSNERVARAFARQLAVAYPAHPEDALAALAGAQVWPGDALVWARLDDRGVRFLATR